MQFDPALAAQSALREAEIELGSDWPTAVELEHTFSSNAGVTARAAYEGLLSLAQRYPRARSFQAFCIYITWQQVTEETIARHFETGMKLAQAYLANNDATGFFSQTGDLLLTGPTLTNVNDVRVILVD